MYTYKFFITTPLLPCRNTCFFAFDLLLGATVIFTYGSESLQNAMTSSRERMSAGAEGYRTREVTDGVRRAPLLRGATQSTGVLEQILGC